MMQPMNLNSTGAFFEIRVDGIPRSYRDVKETALEAGRFLKSRQPASDIFVVDMRDQSVTAIGRDA
jgi:hypothetical protein